MSWQKAQEWEFDWWDSCANTFGEEQKQLLYADRMGLRTFHDGKSPYNFDLSEASVLDIGGGPTSLLLKCRNVGRVKVVDPLMARFPGWVVERYIAAGIGIESARGEDISEPGWDECWVYNVLQHTYDPEKVVSSARKVADIIRLFEWIDTPTNEGHLHTLTEKKLNKWLCGEGKVERLVNENTCTGTAYYGIFPT